MPEDCPECQLAALVGVSIAICKDGDGKNPECDRVYQQLLEGKIDLEGFVSHVERIVEGNPRQEEMMKEVRSIMRDFRMRGDFR